MKEHLISQVMEIMRKIEDTQDLIKIYTVAKTYYENSVGGRSECRA